MAFCKAVILVGALLLVPTFQMRIQQESELAPQQPQEKIKHATRRGGRKPTKTMATQNKEESTEPSAKRDALKGQPSKAADKAADAAVAAAAETLAGLALSRETGFVMGAAPEKQQAQRPAGGTGARPRGGRGGGPREVTAPRKAQQVAEAEGAESAEEKRDGGPVLGDRSVTESKRAAKRRAAKQKADALKSKDDTPSKTTYSEETMKNAENIPADKTVEKLPGPHKEELAKARPKAEEQAKDKSQAPGPPVLKRNGSASVKAGGVALLPCEKKLAPLLEEYEAYRQAGDVAGMDSMQVRLLKAHPFVIVTTKNIKAEALAEGVSCVSENFKMNVAKFHRWLKTPEGRRFEEKGKGYDDGCYLTSAVLRMFMPRGFTTFSFTNAPGETAFVVLRGFHKFTGLTATDEDEESGATAEVDAFMFLGYKRSDAQRFVVTTKSNGENGKYTARKVFGEWYGFAGSKNTGSVWKLDHDATALFPIPRDNSNGVAAQVGPKIIHLIHSTIKDMPADVKKSFLESLDKDRVTVIIEQNDPTNEHIFPIASMLADHVAVLDSTGYPLPQREAYAFFDKFKLRHVECGINDDMTKLEAIMAQVRASTEIEGAVIYLERQDDVAVGMVKVKTDHYVKARRTREIIRNALVSVVGQGGGGGRGGVGGTPVEDALFNTQKRLSRGMKELTHVGGCKEHHREWAEFAIAFAKSWAAAYKHGDVLKKKALVDEFRSKYGSMYQHFWEQWQQGKKDAQPVIRLGK